MFGVYRGARVSDIADRVGVTEPLIFRNSRSKARADSRGRCGMTFRPVALSWSLLALIPGREFALQQGRRSLYRRREAAPGRHALLAPAADVSPIRVALTSA